MHCVLIGNYGHANLGDEALRAYFLESFPEIRWTVLSAHPSQPGEVHRLPGGIRSFLFTPWWKTVKAIRQADAVVFGGGSLFTDVESVYACILWSLHVAVAGFCGTPVYLAFQGMGPYRTRAGERLARWSARQAHFLSVRDPASMERVSGWGLTLKVVQTFDPIFSHMQNNYPHKNTKNVFIMIPRHNSGRPFREEAQRLIMDMPNIDDVRIVLLQPDDAREQSFAESLHADLPLPAAIVPARTLDALMEEVSGASFVLSERFHGALAALAADVPLRVIAQGPGDKLSELERFTGSDPAPISALGNAVGDGLQALRSALYELAPSPTLAS